MSEVVTKSFIGRGCLNLVISAGHTSVDIGASEKLELVDKFCYLGDILSVDGDADAAVEARIRIGSNKFRQLVPLLTNKDVSLIISSDLSLQHHVSNMSTTAFYWLRQLRCVRRSLDSKSVATLVHAFVTSRIDQCNAILAGATKSVTDTLQRVMNAAARAVSDTRKFDHGLTQILHDDLHWLDMADRVTYKLGVIMHR